MTVRIVLQCDGTPAERPDMALERCRAFLSLPLAKPAQLAARANAAGYRVLGAHHLCPACSRGAS